ncbi:hypothetical protein A5742_31460 [Mycolicibacterium fortuitum]|uniref:Uncharacterized protein n=1 Tax=Mycolicibacterium fortuitum TaxID=1766 RepID=A0ABD6QJ44_MYCFO|nr:hypothetical protein [Mycolicibacterium fortuitum]OMC41899.1 hypothetical protein A5742_31460 [Mycolicibacterium fortuitum]
MSAELNSVEQRIAEAIQKQANWEGYEIRPDRLTRLAENVRSHLGLNEFLFGDPPHERWWATSIQTQDDNGEWTWA